MKQFKSELKVQTKEEVNKAFRGAKLAFDRSGADTIEEYKTKREIAKLKSWILEAIEFDMGDKIQLVRAGDVLFVNNESWVDYHGE